MERKFKKPYTHRRFVSTKDYSGRRTLKLGAAPFQLPTKNILFISRILNQGNSPKCTAYSAVSIQESRKKKLYDPDAQWNLELQCAGTPQSDGFELKTQLETCVKLGFVPLGQPTPTDKALKYFFL